MTTAHKKRRRVGLSGLRALRMGGAAAGVVMAPAPRPRKPLENLPPEAETICLNCDHACGNKSKCCGGEITVRIVGPCRFDYWTIQTEGNDDGEG